MITHRLSTAYLALLLLALCHRSQAAITNNSENLEHMKNIADSMNRSADPCVDFHQYACGNGGPFLDNAGYSFGKYYLDTIAILEQHYPIRHKVKQSFAEKLHIYDKACEKAENASLLLFLDEVKPGPAREWPFLEEMQIYNGHRNNATYKVRSINGRELIQLLGQLFSYGLNDVFFTYERPGYYVKNMSIIVVPRRSNIDTKQLTALFASLKLPQTLANKYSQEFMRIHHYLQSEFYSYPGKFGDTIRTYAQLKQDPGNLSHLGKFVKAMLPLPVKIEEQSFFFHLSYVNGLLAMQWQPQHARQLINYIMFRFLLYLQETVQPYYHRTSSDTKLALAQSFVYYKHFMMPHKEEYEKAFDSTVKKLYTQIADSVAENRLNLSEKQKDGMHTRIKNLKTNIGNLPANITEAMVEDYYSTLPDLDVDNFYKTELAVRRHAHLETVLCPKDMFCHQSHAHAFYYPMTNTITFPFPALAPPMYHWSWHPLFALSVLGFAAGHEVVHAIDPEIIEQVMSSFKKNSLQVPGIRATMTCLKRQYPTEIMNERLADVIGAQVAFATYKRNFGLQPEFTTTPWQQLFFTSLAQMFCGVARDEIDDEHDGVQVRLHEIVMNSQDFAEAFQCPIGSKMNPVTKCSYI